MTNYKDTLNLPKTKFAMKANLATKEPLQLEQWQKIELYKKMQLMHQDKPKFVLNDGPPYANGDIHIGHALNKILKDTILKAKHFSGYQVPYIPGWDCHGLPIEHKVEQKVGKAGDKISKAEFRKKCREYALTQVDKQRTSFMRLGVFGDWFNPYLTMDHDFEANIIRTLADIVKAGHLTRGERPVYWCTNCASSLAEAEVEYKDKKSPSIEVTFPVVDTVKLDKCFGSNDVGHNTSIVIWTTTPWTLIANEAVCLHPDFTYALLAHKDKYYVIAEELVDNFSLGKDAEVIATAKGSTFEGITLQHPLQDRTVPVILGTHVTLEAGTGCVHTAPAHGLEDFVATRKYNIDVYNPVAANGCYKSTVADLAGVHVFKANPLVIEMLQAKGNLLSQAELYHSYPHCWRHKTPLIFLATPQWFISMDAQGLREAALAEIKRMSWVPKWGEERIRLMVAGRPDWCISRQRTWGTPIPLYLHKDTGELHPDTLNILHKVADLVAKEGLDIWYELDDADLLGSTASDYTKLTDTLDVWFDAGVVHNCVAAQQVTMHDPADLYIEGSDQYRGWFQSSLLTAVAMKQQGPCKQIVTHGFTVDAQGRKLSKSLGNNISPDTVIKKQGADVLRLWVASVDYTAEVSVSEEVLKRVTDTYRRIRNTARFLLANIADFVPGKDDVSPDKMLQLDVWLLDTAATLQEEIIQAYNSYQFHLVVQYIHNFCANELGAFYLDIIKDRQYTGKSDGIPRRSAQTALYHVANAFTRWLAPILSFTAEEIWQYLPGANSESIFLNIWYQDFPKLSRTTAMDKNFWHKMQQVRDAVNKELEEHRAKGTLGSPLEAEVSLYCNGELLEQLKLLGSELKFLLITSNAKIYSQDTAPEDAVVSSLCEGLTLKIQVFDAPKCERCWHRASDVSNDSQYPDICGRCISNLTEGEIRQFL